jgi:hypothetical protein
MLANVALDEAPCRSGRTIIDREIFGTIVPTEIGDDAKERQKLLFRGYAPSIQICMLTGVKGRADERVSGEKVAGREALRRGSVEPTK